MAVNVSEAGRGTFLVTEDGRVRVAYAVSDRGGTWVFLEGQVYVIPDARAGSTRRPAAEQQDDAALSAPMPANVVDVKAAVGNRVSKGDLLVMLEAMKMELPIRAPRDATVKSVLCRVGDLVQPGVPLIELQ